ncbi:MAG TPA: ferrochelatase [Gammaproteobacteria bacterium]|nr:ferrochelatase [Gammaproteobacteria bacterium]
MTLGILTSVTKKHSAILLTNLGSPAAPTPVAVKHYLKEFLSDPYVIKTPRWIWLPILHCFILPFRSSKSAALYQKIWTEQGSPLLVNSTALQQALQKKLIDLGYEHRVALAMRYGAPSIENNIRQLQQDEIEEIIILPLYPQFSHTTYTTTEQSVLAWCDKLNYQPKLHWIPTYHRSVGYIRALAQSIRPQYEGTDSVARLLISFHGLPKEYVDAGDPYANECQQTATDLASELNLRPEQWSLAYQSRFGPKQWLNPYTDEVLEAWAREGVAEVTVVCPGFSADCLETLEEINQTYRQIFLQAGGEKYNYVPALNADPAHVELIYELLTPFL